MVVYDWLKAHLPNMLAFRTISRAKYNAQLLFLCDSTCKLLTHYQMDGLVVERFTMQQTDSLRTLGELQLHTSCNLLRDCIGVLRKTPHSLQQPIAYTSLSVRQFN